jgi:ER-bound oxygenase mpaB/B'/Rubber oxygenase, catalytic domain
MANGKWSDDQFLDSLRQQGDPQADEAVRLLLASGGERAVGYVFKVMRANDDPLPDDAPEPLRDFMEATHAMPPEVDMARLQRGGEVFLRHAMPACIVFLASSLPRGYSAPCLCEILSISRDLQKNPYGRLMGVIQMLVNISNGDAFQPRGRAVVTAQKLRLLHAGVRTLAARFRPQYSEQFGVPVNHEDMLATIMGFSFLLIDGLRRLGLGLTAGQEEDLYYLWRIFSQLMGIHPPGRPEDDSLIPANVAEAEEFYASFVRRHDAPAEQNPHGVSLAQDNLGMMESLLPPVLRKLGFRYAPLVCMADLMTREEMAVLGLQPLAGHRIFKTLFTAGLRLFQGALEAMPFSALLARQIFKDMIDGDRDGEVTFSVPFTLLNLRSAAME